VFGRWETEAEPTLRLASSRNLPSACYIRSSSNDGFWRKADIDIP
jgi:hypothetical protein